MAITIKSKPGQYFSAHGDLIWVVYEATKANDPVTYPNYKYVADVYIGATQVTRIKKVPQPDNKMGVFNLGDIIRNYVSSVFNPTAGALRVQTSGLAEFFTEVTIRFGEEYDFTTYTGLTVDDPINFFNHYNNRMFGQLTILGDYLNEPLMTRPYLNTVLSDTQNLFYGYFPETTTNYTVAIKAYNAAGGLLGTITQTLTPVANELQLLNIGPGNLAVVDAGNFPASTAYYLVTIDDADERRFNMICEPKYDHYTVHFLNKFGSFDSKDFCKISRKTLAITKTDFGKLPYTVDASGNVSYYNANNVYNETKSIYASQFSDKLTLNSDFITDEEYVWLGELILSPLIYVEMDSYYIPASIIQSDYEYKKQINDKLTNITIELQFGDQFSAQYR